MRGRLENWVGCLLGAALAMAAAGSAAKGPDVEARQAKLQALNGPPPYLFAPAEEPAWVERVIGKLAKQNGLHASDHRLFHKDGTPTYLAVKWFDKGRPVFWPSWLSVYRVNVISPGNVRLRFVRGDEETSFSFEIASGYDLTGGGIPILSVFRWGGRVHHRNGIRVFKLTGNTVDVTPAKSAYFSVKLLGDGSGAAAIDLDRGWMGFFPGCGPCGPAPDIVYRWTSEGRISQLHCPSRSLRQRDRLAGRGSPDFGRFRKAGQNGAWGLRSFPALLASGDGSRPQPPAVGEDRASRRPDERGAGGGAPAGGPTIGPRIAPSSISG